MLTPFFQGLFRRALPRLQKKKNKCHAPWHGRPGEAPTILTKELGERENGAGGEGRKGCLWVEPCARAWAGVPSGYLLLTGQDEAWAWGASDTAQYHSPGVVSIS